VGFIRRSHYTSRERLSYKHNIYTCIVASRHAHYSMQYASVSFFEEIARASRIFHDFLRLLGFSLRSCWEMHGFETRTHKQHCIFAFAVEWVLHFLVHNSIVSYKSNYLRSSQIIFFSCISFLFLQLQQLAVDFCHAFHLQLTDFSQLLLNALISLISLEQCYFYWNARHSFSITFLNLCYLTY